MSQISFAIPPVTQSEWQFRWQLTVNTAFASGSLTAALLNLGVLISLSLTRSALSRLATERRWWEHVNSGQQYRDPLIRRLINGSPISEPLSFQHDEGCQTNQI